MERFLKKFLRKLSVRDSELDKQIYLSHQFDEDENTSIFHWGGLLIPKKKERVFKNKEEVCFIFSESENENKTLNAEFKSKPWLNFDFDRYAIETKLNYKTK